MKREIYPKVKVIINQAMKEAKSFDDIKIRPEHVLLSMLTDNNNNCVNIIKKMNINTNDLYDIISDHVRKSDLTPRLNRGNTKTLPFSEETKEIIKAVDNECEKLKDNKIDTQHIMLAMLLKRSPITDLLGELKINYNSFKKTMDDMKAINNSLDSNEDDMMEDNDSFKHKQKPSDTKNKTPVLDNFCRDISKAAEKGELDLIIGRTKEIKRVSQILSRRKKNNCILIGIPGSGKSSIIEGIAQLIQDNNAPRTLIGKRILSLDLSSIVAGTKYRGQFEERMKAILEECRANPNVILFIDEVHTIVGAGNSSGSLDASNIIKPALVRGELQIIGATTLDEYRENIEKDGALTRRFQEVLIEEPSIEETKTILMNIKEKYEKHHKVKYTEEAIDECVKLSARYIMDRAMPDKAIDVMDEAGASTNVNVDKPEIIKKLEAKRLEINEKKKEVVVKQKYEEAAKLRDEEKKLTDDLRQAMVDWNIKLDKKITEVGVELISEVVSMMSGIPITKISIQENKRLMNMDKELTGKIIGQDAAVTKIVKAIKRSRIGIKDKSKPSSFILCGHSGSGKTLLAKLLAEYLYGDIESLIRFDMSEYMEKHSVSKLIGSPNGYIGYEEGGQLTEKIRRKPYSILLLDEIEKAHPDVFNIFLQVLSDGQLMDGLGRRVNFKNTLIIMTSNIGVKELSDFGTGVGFKSSSDKLNTETTINSIMEKALKKTFRPEFLNRIDEIIMFNRLTKENINDIVYLEIEKLEKRIAEMGFKIKINKDAVEFLAKEGYSEEYGARPLSRSIQHHIEDKIADEILNSNISEGETINITFDKDTNEIIVKSLKQPKK